MLPLPWCPSSVAGLLRRMEEGLEPAPYLIRGEGEKKVFPRKHEDTTSETDIYPNLNQ